MLGTFFSILSLSAQDLRQPPTLSDVDAILSEGCSGARDRLAPALISAYHPGIMGASGSSGNAVFTSWLNLWRWCELLARSSEEESKNLLEKHLFLDKSANKPIFVGTGLQPEPTFVPLPPESMLEIIQNPSSQEKLFPLLLPKGFKPESNPLSEHLNQGFLKNVLNDIAFSRTFFSTLTPEDFTPLVLSNLQEIWSAHLEKWKAYQNLAIALAVVYDVSPPSYWPHPQVKQELVPRENYSIANLFAQWVEANESKATLLDLRKLTPEQLKFVVDAPVSTSELDWARKNVRLSRTGFDQAFFQVAYRQERLEKQEYIWTKDPYLLKTILARGGICVDQAYFAMLAGKARGLPTLFFTGQGANGGHAWFGYMKSDDRWELDCGRYATQNYVVGEALDPQKWAPINDHELKQLAACFRDKPEFSASTNDIIIATLIEKYGDNQKAAKAFESAVRTCPLNPDAWKAQGEFLNRSGTKWEIRKKFHEAGLKQFANNRDIKAFHQQCLATLAREQGDTATAEKLENLALMQNRRKRSDLSVNIAARQMTTFLDAGNLDAAGKEFRKQLNALGKTGGGNLFQEVFHPYVTALIESDKKADALRAIEMIRKKMSPEPGSLLSLALEDLENSAK